MADEKRDRSQVRAYGTTFGESLERVLSRFRWDTRGVLRGAAAASVLVGGGPAAVSGCATEVEPIEGHADALIESGIRSWAQERGIRTTDVVRFAGRYWHRYDDCGFRGGCSTVELAVQLFVQRVPEASLEDKRVGVVYRLPGAHAPQTAVGYFVRGFDDGREEWHVPVRYRTWEGPVVTFDAWYEDGTEVYDDYLASYRPRTWVDDNGGDLYATSTYARSVLTQVWTGAAPVSVGADGVAGTLDFRVANFDYEKELEMVWTVDDWKTVQHFGMGDGEPNAFYWIEPMGAVIDGHHDFGRWRIDLDVPGPVSRFEYAVVYRHGFAPGARTEAFWDNNGGRNYVIEAPAREARGDDARF